MDEPGIPFLSSKFALRIDHEYQREICDATVNDLRRNWSWAACGSLLVAERLPLHAPRDKHPKEFFVFDGQNRLEAAMQIPQVDEMPLLVFRFASVEDEALAFYLVNCHRKPVSVFDRVHALLRAKDQATQDAVELMHSQGYQPGKKGGDHTVTCLAAFLRYHRRERGLFVDTWPLVAQMHDGRPIMDRPLAAIMYLAKYADPDINSDEGKARLLAVGYDAIMGAITRMSAMFDRCGPKVYAQSVVELLNKGRRHNRFHLRNEDEDE